MARRFLAEPSPIVPALTHLVLGVLVLRDPRNLHDEGLAMFGFARSLQIAFWPSLFFQKVKPVLALFYFPFARIGLVSYLVAHVAFASIGVYCVGAVAKALGRKYAWVAPWCVALSPLYVWCSGSGISNSDGVAATAVALYLLEVRKSRFAAGVLLGMLPWIRFETGLFTVVVVIFELTRERDLRLLRAVLVWPALYYVAGAIYHHSILWPLLFRPEVGGMVAGLHESERATFASHSALTAFGSFLAFSPLLFWLVLSDPKRLRGVERPLAALASLYFVTYLGTHFRPMPFGPLFVVGFSARNGLMPLAAAALLVPQAIESATEAPPRSPRALLMPGALLAIGLCARLLDAGPGYLWLTFLFAGSVALARAGFENAIALAIVAALASGSHLATTLMDREGYSTASLARACRLPEITAVLSSMPRTELSHGVFTNNHTLAAYAERTGQLEHVTITYLLPLDHLVEIGSLSDRANGQFEAVLRALPRGTYGAFILPDELRTDHVPDGAVFALIDDRRTAMLIPDAIWAPHWTVIRAAPGFRVLRFRRDVPM